MKRFLIFSMLAAFLGFTACNKDEEIIADIPADASGQGEFTVLEYMPAPGQFIGDKTAGFDAFSSMADACAYAQGRLDSGNFVSLGAWGGYIIVKAEGGIPNGGAYDFAIAGNSFATSNEPGIVWVMADANGNGLPDDQWFELKGSHFGEEGYERNYSVTYFRPSSDKADIRWLDSHGVEGSVKWLGSFHSQNSYYPSWIEEDSYTLCGSRLPSLASQDASTGLWTNPPFAWGYADNAGDDSVIEETGNKNVQKSFFRISDAIDGEGNSVMLERIDFIKVQTAINAGCGNIGETSTEVLGFFL